MGWLLLLHQIPPKPPYFRAKVLRRLTQLGSFAIKNSAYLLPASDETLEDFEWVRGEVAGDGGEAWLFRVEAMGGLTDAEIREGFRQLRAADYVELADAARALVEAGPQEADWRRLKRRWDEVRRIDFFGAPGREEVERLMNTIDRTLHGAPEAVANALSEYHGRTWVTRRGVKVDRIASTWLIRRFIDPAARFVFVDLPTYQHASGELRFDMFEGEFTHRGERCTFEVLLELVPQVERALEAIGQVVHDIDLKETKFGRAETAGVAALIEGIVLRHGEDARRIEEGAALFDSLYARLKAG